MAKVLMKIPINEFTPEDVRANPAEVLDQINLDSLSTYALKKAALAADNCFYDYSERIVALPSEFYLRSLVSDSELENLLDAPEWYAWLI